MEHLKEIIKNLFENIPDGNIKVLDIDGVHVSAFNENGHLRIDLLKRDEELLNEIKEFREIMNSLEDCLFLELTQEVEEDIDLKEFDELMNQEFFTAEEKSNISYMMSYVKNTLCEMIDDEVDRLYEIRDKVAE